MAEKKREIWKGFFVLEGMDGSGTTTQLELCRTRAQQENLALDCEAEPTTGAIGTLLRRFLRRELEGSAQTLAWLFAADRQEHLFARSGIQHRLTEGRKILTDRYWFSSMAYQSLDLSWDQVWALQATFPLPEAIFFLDVDTQTAAERRDQRALAEELFEKAPLQERIRSGYHLVWEQLQRESPDSEIIIIDGRKPKPEIHSEIWERLCR
ncbi:MAG: dTMP kinase [Spirochaetales bacterium]|nr:dTMP kinase [Spirochaetales bacterium]